MRWAIALTVIGFLLLSAFTLILLNAHGIMMEYTAAWILTGFIGCLTFCLGTALL